MDFGKILARSGVHIDCEDSKLILIIPQIQARIHMEDGFYRDYSLAALQHCL